MHLNLAKFVQIKPLITPPNPKLYIWINVEWTYTWVEPTKKHLTLPKFSHTHLNLLKPAKKNLILPWSEIDFPRLT